MEVIDVHALQQKLKVSDGDCEGVLRLLFDLSDVIVRDKLPEQVDLPSILGLTKNEISPRKEWVRCIAELTPGERLSCCIPNKVNARNVGGRMLFLNPHVEGELLFGDDPVAWIRNGLWALDQDPLPLLTSSEEGKAFLPCPALLIQPCEIPGNRKIATPTIPASTLEPALRIPRSQSGERHSGSKTLRMGIPRAESSFRPIGSSKFPIHRILIPSTDSFGNRPIACGTRPKCSCNRFMTRCRSRRVRPAGRRPLNLAQPILQRIPPPIRSLNLRTTRRSDGITMLTRPRHPGSSTVSSLATSGSLLKCVLRHEQITVPLPTLASETRRASG